jgi:hypothetical protein
LARIELEDAKAELEHAQSAAKSMEERIATGEDVEGDDEGDWIECVNYISKIDLVTEP